MIKFKQKWCFMAMLVFGIATISPVSGTEKPNIVIILTDDMGRSDLGCYGATKIQTPNIDQMASEGMRFGSFYVFPVCTPTRAALMTGCYPNTVSLSGVLSDNTRGLNPDEITIAELLKGQGYVTALLGKWHLGFQTNLTPTSHGFDYWFGTHASHYSAKADATTYVYADDCEYREGWDYESIMAADYNTVPGPIVRNDTVIQIPMDPVTLTKRVTEETVQFITKNKDKPFFAYVAHGMPHFPLAATESFLGTSERGLYGDVIHEIDWSIGVIMQTIKDLGLDGNTLVFFANDNGPLASEDHGSSAPLRGNKGTTWEGGVRVPFIARWPGRIPANRVSDEIAAIFDFLPTIAPLAGAQVPDDRTIQGKSIWPILSGEEGAKSPHDAYFYCRVNTVTGVRRGDWKYHEDEGVPELYNLKDDIGETTNLISQYAELADELKARRDSFAIKLVEDKRPSGEAENYPPKVSAPEPEDWVINPDIVPNEPFVAHSISGRIELENFDKGGQGTGYNDNDAENQGGAYRPDEGVDLFEGGTEGNYTIGKVKNGEWLSYTIDSVAGGTYDISIGYATPRTDRSIAVELSGVQLGLAELTPTSSFGDYQVETIPDIKIPTIEPLVMKVTLQGGTMNVDYIEFLKKNDAAFAVFSASAYEINKGESISFTDQSGNGPDSWSWTFEGGTPSGSTGQHPVVRYDSAGIFDVSLKVTNELGSDVLLRTIEVIDSITLPPPVADFSSDYTSVTEGGRIVFRDETANDPTSWTWEFEGGSPSGSSEQNPSVVYTNPGTYGVKLIAANHIGSDTMQKSMYITVIPSEQTGKHLFILSGQSNMANLDPEISFIPAVENKFGAENTLVVKHAKKGLPIRNWYRDWVPPASADSLQADPYMYEELMELVNERIDGKLINTISFVWMQGERDAVENLEEVYESSLIGLYNQLCADLNRSDVNFIIGRLSDCCLSNSSWVAIRDIQVRVADMNPRFEWINTDDCNSGLNTDGEEITDNKHMSVEGYKTMGQRFADEAIKLIEMFGYVIPLPETPLNLSVEANQPNMLELSWSNPDTSVVGFHLYRDGTNIVSTDAAYYLDSSLEDSTTYYYYVVAYNRYDLESQPSDTISATTLPAEISNVIYPEKDIRIYPNPAKDLLNISLDNILNTPLIFSIYDLRGSLVLSEGIKAGNTEITIDIAGLNNGIYTCILEGPPNQQKAKIAIIR